MDRTRFLRVSAGVCCALAALWGGMESPRPARAAGEPTPAAGGSVPRPELVPSEEEILGWIERICAQGIRRPGHSADLWTEQFVAEQFKQWGLEDITFQPVPLEAWFEGDTRLTLQVDGRPVDMNAFPMAWVKWAQAVEGPVMKFTGAGDLDRVAGKVVVVDVEMGMFDVLDTVAASQWIWDPDQTLLETRHIIGMPQASRSGRVITRILERNPAGVIAVLRNYYESPYIWGTHERTYSPGVARIPAVFVSPANGMRLDEYLAKGPVTARIEVDARSEPVVTHNVMATLPGATDEIVQVSSHHEGPFFGATEEAAGTALVLAQAKYWSLVPREERPHTLVFLVTSAHILGSPGERAMVRLARGQLERTVLAVSLETPAIEYDIVDNRLVNRHRPEPRRMYTSQVPELASGVIEAVEAEDLRRTMVLPADVLGHPRSAGGTFHAAGVPVVCFIGGPPVYYFGLEDTLDKVDREVLVPVTRAVIRIMESVRGETAAGMRARATDLPEVDFETAIANWDQPDRVITSERAKAHQQFIRSFDKNGDGRLDDQERAALRAYVVEKYYGKAAPRR